MPPIICGIIEEQAVRHIDFWTECGDTLRQGRGWAQVHTNRGLSPFIHCPDGREFEPHKGTASHTLAGLD